MSRRAPEAKLLARGHRQFDDRRTASSHGAQGPRPHWGGCRIWREQLCSGASPPRPALQSAGHPLAEQTLAWEPDLPFMSARKQSGRMQCAGDGLGGYEEILTRRVDGAWRNVSRRRGRRACPCSIHARSMRTSERGRSTRGMSAKSAGPPIRASRRDAAEGQTARGGAFARRPRC